MELLDQLAILCLIFGKPPICFPQQLHHCTFPAAMRKVPILHICVRAKTGFSFLFFLIAIRIGVRWYITVLSKSFMTSLPNSMGLCCSYPPKSSLLRLLNGTACFSGCFCLLKVRAWVHPRPFLELQCIARHLAISVVGDQNNDFRTCCPFFWEAEPLPSF